MCRISRRLLDRLNHDFGNIKDGDVIKQYVFTEDTPIGELKEFMNHYYPNVDFDNLINEDEEIV